MFFMLGLNSLHTPAWPGTHSNHLASASQVLGPRACANTLSSCTVILHETVLVLLKICNEILIAGINLQEAQQTNICFCFLLHWGLNLVRAFALSYLSRPFHF